MTNNGFFNPTAATRYNKRIFLLFKKKVNQLINLFTMLQAATSNKRTLLDKTNNKIKHDKKYETLYLISQRRPVILYPTAAARYNKRNLFI